MENQADTPAATADQTQQAEPGATPAPAPAPSPAETPAPAAPMVDSPPDPDTKVDQAATTAEQAAPVPPEPVWTDPPDVTAEARAYYWELEHQIRLRQEELLRWEQSDPQGVTSVMLQRLDRMQTLSREIKLLNAAWAHPPFTIKDWTGLPPALPGLPVDAPVRPPRISMEQQHADDVMEAITDCKLDPLAMRRRSKGCSSDREIAWAHYLAGRLARRQATSSKAQRDFNHGWQTLRDTGRVRWA